ncbi:MAG: PspC domain-containing protein [bacterium]|nr:PspC domain-containing protein [bacterium]
MKKLYRSTKSRMLAGVCGGIGEFLGIDPNIVRLLWIALSLPGAGILLYAAAWLIVPEESAA